MEGGKLIFFCSSLETYSFEKGLRNQDMMHILMLETLMHVPQDVKNLKWWIELQNINIIHLLFYIIYIHTAVAEAKDTNRCT